MMSLKFALIGCVLILGNVLGLVAPVDAVAQEELDAVGASERQALLADVVTPFLEALQTGDVPALEQLIGGNLALSLGRLLRENKAYPDFLRQRYGGTTVQAPIEIVQYHQAARPMLAQERHPCMAVVHLQTPDGRPDHFRLHLEQDARGVWKVIDKQMVR